MVAVSTGVQHGMVWEDTQVMRSTRRKSFDTELLNSKFCSFRTLEPVPRPIGSHPLFPSEPETSFTFTCRTLLGVLRRVRQTFKRNLHNVISVSTATVSAEKGISPSYCPHPIVCSAATTSTFFIIHSQMSWLVQHGHRPPLLLRSQLSSLRFIRQLTLRGLAGGWIRSA